LRGSAIGAGGAADISSIATVQTHDEKSVRRGYRRLFSGLPKDWPLIARDSLKFLNSSTANRLASEQVSLGIHCHRMQKRELTSHVT
jgi:hypothetical protein